MTLYSGIFERKHCSPHLNQRKNDVIVYLLPRGVHVICPIEGKLLWRTVVTDEGDLAGP